jgi:hypothetical protein
MLPTGGAQEFLRWARPTCPHRSDGKGSTRHWLPGVTALSDLQGDGDLRLRTRRNHGLVALDGHGCDFARCGWGRRDGESRKPVGPRLAIEFQGCVHCICLSVYRSSCRCSGRIGVWRVAARSHPLLEEKEEHAEGYGESGRELAGFDCRRQSTPANEVDRRMGTSEWARGICLSPFVCHSGFAGGHRPNRLERRSERLRRTTKREVPRAPVISTLWPSIHIILIPKGEVRESNLQLDARGEKDPMFVMVICKDFNFVIPQVTVAI